MGIPQQLHQIWIGPDQQPNHLIKTWTDQHPNWSHFVWDEDALDHDLAWTDGARKVYDQYMQDGRYCGAANVARVLILHQYGGVYVDADMRCRHRLDGAWFMDHQNWISQSPHDPNRSQNAAMGAQAGSVLMGLYADRLEEIGQRDLPIHPSWKTTGALLFDGIRTLKPEGINFDLGFVPSPAFHPRQKNGATNPGLWTYTGIIYADHYFYSTHGRKLPA